MQDKTESLEDIRVSMKALLEQRDKLVSISTVTGDYSTLGVYDRTTYYPIRKLYRQTCARLGHDFQEEVNSGTGYGQMKCNICGVGNHGG